MPFNPQMNQLEKATWLGETFRSIDWLIPAFLSIGFLETLARTIEVADEVERLEILKSTMADVYNTQYIATMYLERYSKLIHIRDFSRQIDECFRAFFSGYRSVSITAMIPVLEGIVRKIATLMDRDVGEGTQGLRREFELLVEEEKKSPHRFEERLIMFELLLEFMRDRFLRKTSKYEGLQEFNRHGILHGVFTDFGEELNFFRLIMLLETVSEVALVSRQAVIFEHRSVAYIST